MSPIDRTFPTGSLAVQIADLQPAGLRFRSVASLAEDELDGFIGFALSIHAANGDGTTGGAA